MFWPQIDVRPPTAVLHGRITLTAVESVKDSTEVIQMAVGTQWNLHLIFKLG